MPREPLKTKSLSPARNSYLDVLADLTKVSLKVEQADGTMKRTPVLVWADRLYPMTGFEPPTLDQVHAQLRKASDDKELELALAVILTRELATANACRERQRRQQQSNERGLLTVDEEAYVHAQTEQRLAAGETKPLIRRDLASLFAVSENMIEAAMPKAKPGRPRK